MFNFFKKPKEETRATNGYTAEFINSRQAYIQARSGIGELTSSVQSCVSLWEHGLSNADIHGTDLLKRQDMALIGRSLAMRGEMVFYITEMGLIPAIDWEFSTSFAKPRAYRLSIPEIGGAKTITALAGEVVHIRIGADISSPYNGVAPLRGAQLTAGLLHSLETALSEVYENAPIGSQIVPYPESDKDEMDRIGDSFRGKRGKLLLRESVNVGAAGGATPSQDWKPQDVTPDLTRSMTRENLGDARNAIVMAFGVLPAMFNNNTTGPLIREAQRHLAAWTLQPIANLLAEELSDKLDSEITIDTLRPLQAFDAGGRARAFSALIQTMSQAKEAGLDAATVDKALSLVNWGENDHAI